MGCRCKERREFLKKQWAELRQRQKAGEKVDLAAFLKETAVKMPIGQRNVVPPMPEAVDIGGGWYGFRPPPRDGQHQ